MKLVVFHANHLQVVLVSAMVPMFHQFFNPFCTGSGGIPNAMGLSETSGCPDCSEQPSGPAARRWQICGVCGGLGDGVGKGKGMV